MTRTVNNSQDILDSRDVIARLDELESGREELSEALDDADGAGEVDDARQALSEWDEENAEELRALKALAAEGEGSPDWMHGETLIRETYFKEYAQQLAEDCGMLENADTWPGRCIDWKQAAKELKQDYFSVDFDGVDYWVRA